MLVAPLTALLAAAIVGLIHFQMQAKIDYQLSRNQYLEAEIAKVDEEIKEIKELQKVRRSLVERMEVIQDLQASRPSIVPLPVTTPSPGILVSCIPKSTQSCST